MKARNLIPNNNIRGMLFKDAQGITVFEAQFDYEYDEDGYPMTADLFILNHGDTSKIYLDYYYQNKMKIYKHHLFMGWFFV